MDSINHQLHRLLLSANLLEHVFEGLGCVNECYRTLFITITKTRTSRLITYVTLVKDWILKCVSWFQKHNFDSNPFINVKIFNNLLLHDLCYTNCVLTNRVVSYHNGDIPFFSIFSIIKWTIYIF